MFRTRTLRRSVFHLVSVIAVASLVALVTLTTLSITLIGRQISQRQRVTVLALAHHGDEFLSAVVQSLETVGQAVRYAPPRQRSALLRAIRARNPELTQLYLQDASGRVTADASETASLTGLDLSRVPAFAEAQRERRIVVSTPFLSPDTGTIVATIAIPYYDDEELQGVVLGELSLRELQGAIDHFGVSPEETVAVLDQSGTVLAHPQQVWVQERRNLGDLPLFLDGLAGRQFVRVFYDHHLKKWEVGSVARMATGWVVIAEQPLSTAIRPVLWMLGSAIAAIAISLIIAAIVQSRGLRQITHPIVRLATVADALANGVQLDTPPNDRLQYAELTSLQGSFAHIAHQLHTTIQTLEQRELRLRESLSEKETLLQEIHHRVKNNLQVVTSLLRLQARKLDDAQAIAALQESQQRIAAMALIHELLYRSEDLAHIDAAIYFRELINQLLQIYGADRSRINVVIKATQPWLSLNHAVPCGLIVNELVSNSLKYAFPDERSGTIGVALTLTASTCLCMQVWDTGVGLPPDITPASTNSLGIRLVQSFVRQLQGELMIQRSEGTTLSITFPTLHGGEDRN